MLAIPVKKLGEDPIISEYFGRSKWFALVDEGVISFEKNVETNGCKIVDWLYDLGVTKTFINFIGLNPYEKMNKMDIECISLDEKTACLTQIIEKFETNNYIKIDKKNFDRIIDFTNGCQDNC